MSPVLQALVAVAVGVSFSLLLLGQMAFVVRCYATHMCKIILTILGWIFLGIFLQDLNNLPTTAPSSATNTAGRLVLTLRGQYSLRIHRSWTSPNFSMTIL